MLRRFGTAAAVLAFLAAFAAAPFTHAHHRIDSVSDGHHPHAETLVHTHASPHARHDADHSNPDAASPQDGDEKIWSVESFVLQQPAPGHAPAPALRTLAEPRQQPAGLWLGAHPPQPQAHGPPVGLPSGLRAPPACLPTFV